MLSNAYGTQTGNSDISDSSTQTKAEIKVVYKNADGTVYKEFVVNADKGTILDTSDLEMLPDDMEFNDDFMFYEVKGDGHDVIERIVEKVTTDQGSQTNNPDISDGSTQTANPDTSDGSTQTDTPDSKDNGTQTDSPKDEPTQSIPKQDGISEVKPLSNKVSSGYTRVQPTKAVGHLSSAGQLPKAGSTDNSKLGLIGATFALLGCMIGFVSRRKVHK